MKLPFLTLITALLTTLAAKADFSIYKCEGVDTEGVSMTSFDNENFIGDVAWDCFPGGGICHSTVAVSPSKDSTGSTVYKGKGFWMVVHDAQQSTDGKYKAHLIARDHENGLVINEFIECQKKSAQQIQ